MSGHEASWAELRSCVERCIFQDCPRNIGGRLHVFFERKEDSLTHIRFVAVSQDPGVALKSKHHLTTSEEIETALRRDARKKFEPSENVARNPRDRIRQIFQKEFDPSTSDIYWTHALKCLPIQSDKEIDDHWEKSAPLCVKYFKEELDLTPSRKLIVIAFGGYALAMCLHVLDGGPLVDSQRVTEYIKTCSIDRTFPYGDKDVSLFAFLHPAHRYAHANYEIKMREQQFICRIRNVQEQNELPE